MITRIFGTVTGGRLNLRAAADFSASILASIPNETLLVVTAHDDTWYATTYGSYTGYVMKQYITLLDLANASELAGEVTGGALNMCRTASTSADRLIQIPNNTAITVIDFDADSQWYITDYNGYTGYVMKQYVTVSQPVPNWAYGQVTSNALNVRRQPSTSAGRWNNVWPMNRLVLVKPCDVDGWYETLYRGEPAYVMAKFIKLLAEPAPERIVERMLFMVEPEKGRSKSIYFNGYGGKWCHRFADWLAMNAGMPKEMIPNTSNCGTGMVWFINNANSGGFHFKNAEHKARFISNYSAVKHLTSEISTDEKAYVPAPGDYIYFRWKNAASSVNVSHVGIVAIVGEDSVTTWEGNTGGKVVNRTFALNDMQIVGYGKPGYTCCETKLQHAISP